MQNNKSSSPYKTEHMLISLTTQQRSKTNPFVGQKENKDIRYGEGRGSRCRRRVSVKRLSRPAAGASV